MTKQVNYAVAEKGAILHEAINVSIAFLNKRESGQLNQAGVCNLPLGSSELSILPDQHVV